MNSLVKIKSDEKMNNSAAQYESPIQVGAGKMLYILHEKSVNIDMISKIEKTSRITMLKK